MTDLRFAPAGTSLTSGTGGDEIVLSPSLTSLQQPDSLKVLLSTALVMLYGNTIFMLMISWLVLMF